MKPSRIAANAGLVIASGLMAAALALACLAWQQRSWPLGLACLLSLFTAPLLAFAAVLARNRQLEPMTGAPAHEVVDALRRAELALRICGYRKRERRRPCSHTDGGADGTRSPRIR